MARKPRPQRSEVPRSQPEARHSLTMPSVAGASTAPTSPTAARSLPKSIDAMLARTGEPFDSTDHQFEIKWDGTRCITFCEAGKTRLVNRRGFELRERYPEFACLSRLPSGTVIDGEVVVLENGKPSFRKLQQREQLQGPKKIELIRSWMPASYMIFDVLYLAGENVMGLPLHERRRRLVEVVSALSDPHIMAPDVYIGPGKKLFEQATQHGLEGIMAKRLASSYQAGVRSPDWLKIKVAQTGDFEVLGYTPGEVKGHVGALLIGERRGKALDFKGKVGSGFTDEERVELLKTLAPMNALRQPPRGDVPKDAVWRETSLVCQVRYFEKTPTGMLRGPVFKGFVARQSL